MNFKHFLDIIYDSEKETKDDIFITKLNQVYPDLPKAEEKRFSDIVAEYLLRIPYKEKTAISFLPKE